MTRSGSVIATVVIVAPMAATALAGSACTNSGAADTKKDAGAVLDATKARADTVLVRGRSSPGTNQ